MPLVSTQLDSAFVARYQTGTTDSGAPISKQKTFGGVKATATSEDIYEIVVALFGLLQYPLLEVRRDDRFDLADE
ncbi:MAG: DUF1659 domain-containing protein [Peptococcaceae bacterium]|jgi:hypothetical protein|nr:DUF1659 domain-containing protein [Peptococcaceae bacterium]